MSNPGVVEHLEELTPIKPKVSLSCKECTYKTNYRPRRMAKRRLHNHRRKNHRRDPNNNPEKVIPDEIAWGSGAEEPQGKDVGFC